MREDSAHARNHDLSAAAEIFANGTYFLNTLRISIPHVLTPNPLTTLKLGLHNSPSRGLRTLVYFYLTQPSVPFYTARATYLTHLIVLTSKNTWQVQISSPFSLLLPPPSARCEHLYMVFP